MFLRASRLIDGFSPNVTADPLLSIEGGRISRVTSASEPHVAGDYSFEDATILPGLIDCHVHLTLDGTALALENYLKDSNDLLLLKAAKNAKRAVEAGITTVRDLGARDDVIFSLKEAIAQGIVKGPHLLVAGRPITCKRGHCHWMHGEVESVDDVKELILSQVQKGADFTKIMVNGGGATPGTSCLELQFSYEQVREIAAESHRLKRKVAAHVDCAAAIEISVRAGVDTLEHCEFLAPHGLEIDERILVLLVDQPVSIVPTLSGWYAVRDKESCWSTLSDLQHSFQEYWQEVVAVTRRFKQVGLRLIAGSDAGIPEVAHDSLLLEIELLNFAGLSPMEAIQSATSSAAQALGIEDDRGTIQPGKRADILVVQGNPLKDLRALRRPLLVLKDGEVLRHTQTR